MHAYGTEKWGTALLEVLQRAYEPIFKLELEFASAGEFNERFRKSYPTTDDVLRKCIAFFLNALRETPQKVSAYITQNRKPRNGKTPKRAVHPKTGSGQDRTPATGSKSKKQTVSRDIEDRSLSELVFEALDMKKMSEGEVNAVWTFLKYLRKEGK